MLKNKPRKFSIQKLRIRVSEIFFVKKNLFAGLERNVAILGLVSFFTDASSDMLYPLLPLFVTITLGQARKCSVLLKESLNRLLLW